MHLNQYLYHSVFAWGDTSLMVRMYVFIYG